LPLESISSSTVAKKLGSTAPLYPDDRIDGQMYDDLHTAGVFPSCAAVSFTAAVSILRRSVTPSTTSPCSRASTLAQIICPAQVPAYGDVPLPQGRDPEAAVLLRVDLAARAHEARREDAEDASHDAVAG